MNDYHRPEKESIQIKPGVWIEVSRRMKKASGLGKGVRIINRLEEEERRRIFGKTVRKGKYSQLMIEEASRLGYQVGMAAAAKATGVNIRIIKDYRERLVATGKVPKRMTRKPRYTLAQKQQCVRLAIQIADQEHCGMTRAFKQAGKQLGMGVRCIYKLWVWGAYSGVTQQPSAVAVACSLSAAHARATAQ